MKKTIEKSVNTKLIENICIDDIQQYHSIFEIEEKLYVTDITTFFTYVLYKMVDKEEQNMRQEFFILCSVDIVNKEEENKKITKTIFYKIGFLRKEFAEIFPTFPLVMVEIVDMYTDYNKAIFDFNNHLKNYVSGYELGYEIEFDIINYNEHFVNDSVKQKTITK